MKKKPHNISILRIPHPIQNASPSRAPCRAHPRRPPVERGDEGLHARARMLQVWERMHAALWPGSESQGDSVGVQGRGAQVEEDDDRDWEARKPGDCADCDGVGCGDHV